ncbi:MAG: Hpt domain-containing protein [Candidatus Kryptonium sp.]|nr:Hpt domain-containing protein [Candidatus Kryptonium sp.]MCX7761898.1 Hpt domain-containing protein [Candidatus Kryptonium sp.]MDW8108770.1 Hpt domain-containing protein [Candidatus Kryptonium sp.]
MDYIEQNEWEDLGRKFIEIAEKKINDMKKALSEKNFSLIQIYSHQLKGSGSSFGFDEITEISAQIEQKCVNNSPDEIEKLIDQLCVIVEFYKSKIRRE